MHTSIASSRTHKFLTALLITATLLAGFPVKPAFAASIPVNITTDENTNNINCSLREAIIAADTNVAYNGCLAGSGDDVITLTSGLTYTLSLAGITGTTGDLDMGSATSGNLTIQASGTTPAIIDGGNIDRVLDVAGTGNTSLTVNTITITNGTTPAASSSGGGIRFFGTGTLTVMNSTISNNVAVDTAGCGAGIYNNSAATVNIVNSTIANNTCSVAGSDGGGLWKGTGGTLNITNSTFYGNSTQDAGGGARINAGTATILFSTFSNNSTAAGTGGGLQINNVTTVVTITSSILANNSPNDCEQSNTPTVTLTNTLIELDVDCGTLFNADPGLGGLANNGGPTQTMAITAASVAYNAATSCSVTTDQRGVSRPQNAVCDLGAYELDNTIPSVTINQGVGQPDPTNVPSITFDVVFSEAVTGFDGTDISFAGSTAGGTLSAAVSGSGATYTVTVTGMTSDGTVVASIPAGVAQDGGFNSNTASTSTDNTVTYDATAPDTTITSNPLDPSNSASATFTFTGNDGSGSGIASFECQLDGGGFIACPSPQTYPGLSEGSHTFDVRAIDFVGNVDPTPATFTWVVDTIAPDTTITGNPTNPSNDPNPTFSFIGNDGSGSGVASFECQLDGGGFMACTSGSAFGPLSDGPHTFEVRAVDAAGNADPTPASYIWTIDASLPSVTINQGAGQLDPTNIPSIVFDVAFSEPVTGFTDTDINLAGTAGATTAVVSGSGAIYTVTVTGMTSDGSVMASIGANVAVDASNNGNSASTSTDNTVTYNSSAPDTTIDSNPTNPSSTANATFTFSSPDVDTVGFECQLDGGGWASCTTPLNYTGLSAGSHTFEVRAFDAANNRDPLPASYTWTIDLGFPTVTSSTPANNATLTTGPTQLIVQFSEDVKNDGSAGAANNTANYLLVEDGVNGAFNTVSCAGGLVADDVLITINSATYTNSGGGGPYEATTNINGGVPLSVGTYRLFVCGTTSIEDLAGNELNNGASDALITFTVQPIVAGGGGGAGGNQNTTALLPATGFPMNQVTQLRHQPADKAYAPTDLWLEIPRLSVKMSIVGVPKTKSGWDVTWLNKEAGWLNGSAFPTWDGNSVLTGHVWDALNQPGPFARLKDLKYGDQITIHAFGQVYIFEITENTLVSPFSTKTVFKHAENSLITLVTCEDYREASQSYTYRRMVRAVLVSVTNEK